MGLFLLSFMAELLKASVIALFLISLVLLSRRVEAVSKGEFPGNHIIILLCTHIIIIN